MTYQVLARKWRPQSFADMVGQNHVLGALKNALDSDRLHHAYLFTGTRGVGKTTLARILAKCLNCEKGVSSEPCGSCSACVSIDEGRFVDLIEVDAASRAKVEETRDLMDNVQYAPSSGRYKVYLIDEVHMFSNHSFNALLKTLEEPPPHVKFLLATTEPKKLPVTILSRCLQFNLKHLTRDQIGGQLREIVGKESVTADETSLKLIAAGADGSMRDALSLLDQAISYGNGELKEGQVRDMLGTIDSHHLIELYESLLTANASEMISCLDKMDEHSPDYDAVLAEILSDLHDMAICQMVGDEEVDNLKPELRNLAGRFEKEDLQLYYQIALTGRRDLQIAPEPRIGFEMTIIRMMAFKPEGNSGSTTNSEKATRKIGVVKSAVPVVTPISSENSDITIGQDWKSVIDEMALTGLVKELAGNCILKEHTKEKIHLVLLPSQEHMLKTIQKERLQNAIAERFGKDVKLVISVDELDEETPKQQAKRKEEEKKQNAVESFSEDPAVKEMIDTFSANVEKNTIQPS
ncbi:MAG: DNA polymerase-3 subunit gamma/tau [Gammaproteobacteria bacterium]|jgi:DNA polymerase-3 subunit gamma/tau